MSKQFRTKGKDNAIWKILEHETPDCCPECKSNNSLQYLGFVETYTVGLHGKMYQCNACNAWIDLIWSKQLGKFLDVNDEPASV